MTAFAPGLNEVRQRTFPFPARHFLSVADLDREQVSGLLDLAEGFVALNRQKAKKLDLLKGRTLVNLFFEASTRTQSSFELAGKRLGADVVNMAPRSSSIVKGETLIDTAVTLNAMQPDILVVRHGASGAASLLSQKVTCSVINAGDGQHEHPSQALLDALALRRAFGRIEGLVVAICGDVLHSRVARSNVGLLTQMGARVIMMLRLQLERMQGALVPSAREYNRLFGLDREKLALAAPHVRVMHPGPMNRGVEIDSDVADDLGVSLIQNQVEMGVAARMAVLAAMAARLDNE